MESPQFWILVGLAALALSLLGWRRRRWRRVIVSERGILDRRLGVGWILWDEIEGAYRSGSTADTLRLRVRASERLARQSARFASARQAGGTVELPLQLADTELSAIDVLQRLLRRPA